MLQCWLICLQKLPRQARKNLNLIMTVLMSTVIKMKKKSKHERNAKINRKTNTELEEFVELQVK